jgi:periplasmic divalent cation tolerance protein
MDIILIYITNPTKKEARKVAEYLLKKKLIACANIFSTNSLYHWQGKLADETEYILLAKTSEENYEKVRREVEKIHSYKIPCIIKIPASVNKKYFKWLKETIKL